MFGINSGWLSFLDQLEKKKEGEPLINWQESLDFLIVFIGEGDCRKYILRGWVSPFLDIVEKLYPKDEEDSFVGFEISGGIRQFLRNQYQEMLGDRYGQFKLQHNLIRHAYSASELFEKWLEEFPATDQAQIERIRGALKCQDPKIHIPL